MVRLLRILVLALFLVLPFFEAKAQESSFATVDPLRDLKDSKEPFLFNADDIQYDQNLGVIVARGNVEVNQEGRQLRADQISYNEKDNIVTASGNVTLRDITGDVVYADFVQVNSQLRDGVIKGLRLMLADQSRLVAEQARRTADRKEMDNAVFSPCKLCEKDPSRAPMWQMKARKVTHLEDKQEIQYEDARLEFFGLPVFYTPYFAHPDPNLKRRSGFLPPSITSSDDLGLILRQPYHIAMTPYRDLTLDPIFMTDDGFILANEYRERFKDGRLNLKSSLGYVDKRGFVEDNDQTVRGHINLTSEYDIDEHWRAGADINRVSDKTYLRRYKFDDQDVLTSRVYGEGFYNQSYLYARAMSFQGLRDFDKSDTTPLILPQVTYNYVSPRDDFGGIWSVNSDILNLAREDGVDSRRLVVDAEWKKPLQTYNGHLLDLVLRTNAAGYSVNDYIDTSAVPNQEFDHLASRIVPQAGVTWRYPMVRTGGVFNNRFSQLVEPIASVVASPNVGSQRDIPNEDSQAFEFDESNLFSYKRFPGYDRFAGGSRVDYGVNLGMFDEMGHGGKLFLGQSYRVREDATYAVGSGLENHFSDIVGKLEVNPTKNLDLIYRFRADPDDKAFRRSEISAITQTGPLKLGLDYILLDRLAGSGQFNDREQIGARASLKIDDNWNLSGRMIADVNNDFSTRLWSIGTTYHNECLSAGISLERDFTDDGENRPGTAVMFRIDLKNLGGELKEDYFTPDRGDPTTGTLLP